MMIPTTDLNKEFAAFIKAYQPGDKHYFIPTFPQFYYTQGVKDIMAHFELYDVLNKALFPFILAQDQTDLQVLHITVERIASTNFNYRVHIASGQQILQVSKLLLVSLQFDRLKLVFSKNRLCLPEEIFEDVLSGGYGG